MTQKVATETDRNYSVVFEARDEPVTIGVAAERKRDMPYIARAVAEKADDLSQPYGFDDIMRSPEGTPYNPKDGAAAFDRAIKRLYGTTGRGMKWGPNPPIMEDLQIQELIYKTADGRELTEEELYDRKNWPIRGLAEYAETQGVDLPKFVGEENRHEIIEKLIKVWTVIRTRTTNILIPQGAVQIPGWDIVCIVTSDNDPKYGPVFRLAVQAKKIDEEEVERIKNTVKDELARRSIYKGRSMSTNGGDIAFWCPFRATKAEELIMPADMQERIEVEIFSIMRMQEDARVFDASLLRSKFFVSGEPGTGKTEFTNIVAQVALQNGITVVKHSPNDPLEVTQRILGLHSPSIGIIEDIETYMPQTSDADYHAKRSDILEQFDGGLAKGREVMFMMTTNYELMVEYAMSRQGRIDGYFKFNSLDAWGFQKLVELKLKGRLDKNLDYERVWEEAGDMSSSFLAGIVKISNKYLLHQKYLKVANPVITTENLLLIVKGLRAQWDWHQVLRELNEAAHEPSYRQVMQQHVKDAIKTMALKGEIETEDYTGTLTGEFITK